MALGNMRNHLCIIALYLLAVVSCTPDLGVGTPFVEGQEVTLTASIADNPSGAKQMPGKQRVSGKDAGATIDLTWNAGDQILVSVGDKSAVFTLSSGENTSAGEFTGKMPANGSEYSVSYPVDYSDNVLTHQTYVENGFGNGLMKMSTKKAGTLNNGFTLSADNALLGLQLMGNQTLSRIVVTNPTDQKTYTLNCSNVALSQSPILFYIVVPAGEWGNGFKVDIYAKNAYPIYVLSKVDATTLSPQQAMIMPTIDCSIASELADPPITFLVNRVSFKMVCVRAGSFMMGVTEKDKEAENDEKPRHEVELTRDFFIAETEMTQALWQAIMGNNPSANPSNPQFPVNQTSWDDCQEMIAKLNQLTGLTFRLPTEAEWEYAARGGKHSEGYKYAGSDHIDEVAWYNSTEYHPVAQLKPNELGLYDMSGSVYEWCQDWYNEKAYASHPRIDPIQIESIDNTNTRCLRGGSNKDFPQYSRIANRGYRVNNAREIHYGLRLALDSKGVINENK